MAELFLYEMVEWLNFIYEMVEWLNCIYEMAEWLNCIFILFKLRILNFLNNNDVQAIG